MDLPRIRKLAITNIKSFSEIELNLEAEGRTKDWLLLFGDNGVGKTTLLRCIAMALGGADDAAGMFTALESGWVRAGAEKNEGKIYVEFETTKSQGTKFTEIVIESKNGDEQIKNFRSNANSEAPSREVFACGYGAGRGVEGDRTPTRYRLVDAVYSLFDYETQFSNAELALRRLEDLGTKREEIERWVDDILLLKEGSTSITSEGLVISTNFQDKLPFANLSDGYKSVLTVVTDFIARSALYNKRYLPREELGGIVLIDELDQHLHPAWQRRIIGSLNQQFPNVQFIATTHTPMCAIGATDLKDEQIELAVLETNEEGTVLREDLRAPRGMSADQVLTSALFGLLSTSDDETAEKIQQYMKFVNLGEREGENEQYMLLKNELEKYISSKETDLQDLISESLMEMILKDVREKIRSSPEAHDKLSILLEDEMPIRAETYRQAETLLEDDD